MMNLEEKRKQAAEKIKANSTKEYHISWYKYVTNSLNEKQIDFIIELQDKAKLDSITRETDQYIISKIMHENTYNPSFTTGYEQALTNIQKMTSPKTPAKKQDVSPTPKKAVTPPKPKQQPKQEAAPPKPKQDTIPTETTKQRLDRLEHLQSQIVFHDKNIKATLSDLTRESGVKSKMKWRKEEREKPGLNKNELEKVRELIMNISNLKARISETNKYTGREIHIDKEIYTEIEKILGERYNSKKTYKKDKVTQRKAVIKKAIEQLEKTSESIYKEVDNLQLRERTYLNSDFRNYVPINLAKQRNLYLEERREHYAEIHLNWLIDNPMAKTKDVQDHEEHIYNQFVIEVLTQQEKHEKVTGMPVKSFLKDGCDILSRKVTDFSQKGFNSMFSKSIQSINEKRVKGLPEPDKPQQKEYIKLSELTDQCVKITKQLNTANKSLQGKFGGVNRIRLKTSEKQAILKLLQSGEDFDRDNLISALNKKGELSSKFTDEVLNGIVSKLEEPAEILREIRDNSIDAETSVLQSAATSLADQRNKALAEKRTQLAKDFLTWKNNNQPVDVKDVKKKQEELAKEFHAFIKQQKSAESKLNVMIGKFFKKNLKETTSVSRFIKEEHIKTSTYNKSGFKKLFADELSKLETARKSQKSDMEHKQRMENLKGLSAFQADPAPKSAAPAPKSAAPAPDALPKNQQKRKPPPKLIQMHAEARAQALQDAEKGIKKQDGPKQDPTSFKPQ